MRSLSAATRCALCSLTPVPPPQPPLRRSHNGRVHGRWLPAPWWHNAVGTGRLRASVPRRPSHLVNSRTLALRLSWLLLALPALWTAPPAHSAGGDRIIVSGASGQLGTLTVRALLARGVPADRLILVSRTPEKLQEFAKLRASTRYADF